MELDTGSACSMISKSTFENHWSTVGERPELQHSAAVLLVYGGA